MNLSLLEKHFSDLINNFKTQNEKLDFIANFYIKMFKYITGKDVYQVLILSEDGGYVQYGKERE